MASYVRRAASGNKFRQTRGGYDLDLSYLTGRLIAMSWPAQGFEAWYRNPLRKVKAFLDEQHGGHYRIFSLCSERSYDPQLFGGAVDRFPFIDHQPPPLELVQGFCCAVDGWLGADPANVAVVHCKAGKGRTGTMLCCYLLHIAASSSAVEAMHAYGRARTKDGNGVTMPSQRRYVGYWADAVRQGGLLPPRRLQLQHLELHGLPRGLLPHALVVVGMREGAGGPVPALVASLPPLDQMRLGRLGARSLVQTPWRAVVVEADTLRLAPADGAAAAVALRGDLHIQVFDLRSPRQPALFYAWLHASYCPLQVTLGLAELDTAVRVMQGQVPQLLHGLGARHTRVGGLLPALRPAPESVLPPAGCPADGQDRARAARPAADVCPLPAVTPLRAGKRARAMILPACLLTCSPRCLALLTVSDTAD